MDTRHVIALADKDCNITSKFESLPKDENICHFSNLLFSHFTDDSIIITSSDTHIHSCEISIAYLTDKSKISLTDPYYGYSSLRAPPAA